MKETKNKKGFTLVELLAVIAILAILVIMALPAVLRMYRQSRISSFQNEVRSVYRTAQSQFLSDSMLLESGEMIAYTNAGTSVTGVNVVKELNMTGNTDFKYYVLINVDGKVLNVRASNGTYSFSKQAVDADHDLKIEDIDVETNNDSTLDSNITTTVCPTTEAVYGSSSANNSIVTFVTRQVEGQITVGDELTIADENFYVISSDATNTKLLAKYDLNTTSNSQVSSSQTEVAFSGECYWSSQCSTAHSGGVGAYNYNNSVMFLSSSQTTEINEVAKIPTVDTSGSLISPYDSNGASFSGNPYPNVYDENSSLYTTINLYVDKISTSSGISISGGLMTYEEANNLSTNLRKDLNNTYYWLSSAQDNGQIWTINDEGNIIFVQFSQYYAIRPVLVVPTSVL